VISGRKIAAEIVGYLALRYLFGMDLVSWDEICSYLNGKFGRLNPNTINFCLHFLRANKLIIKIGEYYAINT
jgi:hypothetical protein